MRASKVSRCSSSSSRESARSCSSAAWTRVVEGVGRRLWRLASGSSSRSSAASSVSSSVATALSPSRRGGLGGAAEALGPIA